MSPLMVTVIGSTLMLLARAWASFIFTPLPCRKLMAVRIEPEDTITRVVVLSSVVAVRASAACRTAAPICR